MRGYDDGELEDRPLIAQVFEFWKEDSPLMKTLEMV